MKGSSELTYFLCFPAVIKLVWVFPVSALLGVGNSSGGSRTGIKPPLTHHSSQTVSPSSSRPCSLAVSWDKSDKAPQLDNKLPIWITDKAPQMENGQSSPNGKQTDSPSGQHQFCHEGQGGLSWWCWCLVLSPHSQVSSSLSTQERCTGAHKVFPSPFLQEVPACTIIILTCSVPAVPLLSP